MTKRSLALGLAISFGALAGEPDPAAFVALMVKLMQE
jgi:hypothetical protein